jgi:limonene-1,2-epoxide hydrolase
MWEAKAQAQRLILDTGIARLHRRAPALYKTAAAQHPSGMNLRRKQGKATVPTPSEVVTTFLARWDKPGGLDQAIRDCFTPDTVWENVGMATTTGPDEAIALNAQLARTMGFVTIRVDNLAVAETGNKVLTERVDHMVDADGRTLFSAPVMGIFEIEGGRIAAWRDYFDSAGAAALAGE